MNKYAESLLSSYDLKTLQDLIVEYFIKFLKPLFQDCCVESKRSDNNEQSKIRQLQDEYDANIWQCMYRICFTDDSEARRGKGHKHLTVGYSSADEYETILIGEMTTDNEEEEF